MAEKVSGNPNVFKEAAERKRGGRIENLKKGKKHHGKPEGEMAKMRMDRPRRMSGGRCGSDKNPFSSAHKTSSASKSAD
jgi:hypothetical protein